MTTPNPVTGDEPQIRGVTDLVEIGRGGFGVVYRGHETELDRIVAVKVLTVSLDQTARDRFDRERKAMGSLAGHPNIVTIYGSGFSQDDHPYLLMEYLPQGSLRDRLNRLGPLDWTEALSMAVKLSGAVETAHRAGVLHRDIKPGNVFLSALGEPKLGDFGIARLRGGVETRSGLVTASVAHAAPEVLSGQRPDARSDVYSLASLLYELICGRAPFAGTDEESLVAMLTRVANEPAPRPGPGLPEAVWQVMAAALAKDPEHRTHTAASFAAALTDAQRQVGLPITVAPIEGVTTDEDPTAFISGAPIPSSQSVTPLGQPDISSETSPGSQTTGWSRSAFAVLGVMVSLGVLAAAAGIWNSSRSTTESAGTAVESTDGTEDEDTGPSTTVSTNPSTTAPSSTTAPTTGAEAPSTTLQTEVNPGPTTSIPDGYLALIDETEALTAAFPPNWTDRIDSVSATAELAESMRAFKEFGATVALISAGTNLDRDDLEVERDYAQSRVAIVAINLSGVLTESEFDGFLDDLVEVDIQNCETGDRSDYEDDLMIGRVHRFGSCDGTGAAAQHTVGFLKHDPRIFVLITAQLGSQFELLNYGRVLGTISVDVTRL